MAWKRKIRLSGVAVTISGVKGLRCTNRNVIMYSYNKVLLNRRDSSARECRASFVSNYYTRPTRPDLMSSLYDDDDDGQAYGRGLCG